jgi:hypothetical protein
MDGGMVNGETPGKTVDLGANVLHSRPDSRPHLRLHSRKIVVAKTVASRNEMN